MRLFGTNGFLVLHALLLALGRLLRLPVPARAHRVRRSRPLLAGGFVMASVVPVYFVWITPELFNFSLGVARLLLLALQGGGGAGARAARHALAVPAAQRRRGRAAARHRDVLEGHERAAVSADRHLACCGGGDGARAVDGVASRSRVVAVGLFAVNMAISGEWNYQGGQDRSTFVYEFPFQTPTSGFDVGVPKERDEALTEIIFNRRVFWTNLSHNLRYLFVGRYAGIVPYFFPAAFAILAFLRAPRRRPVWQWLVLVRRPGAAALLRASARRTPGSAAAARSATATSWVRTARSCSCCRRSRSVGMAVVPWIVGGLFVAPLVLNPFVTSFYPGSYAAHGPLRCCRWS